MCTRKINIIQTADWAVTDQSFKVDYSFVMVRFSRKRAAIRHKSSMCHLARRSWQYFRKERWKIFANKKRKTSGTNAKLTNNSNKLKAAQNLNFFSAWVGVACCFFFPFKSECHFPSREFRIAWCAVFIFKLTSMEFIFLSTAMFTFRA